MNKNIWNIKNPKERLAIRERTEAQKRHLISLIKARSQVDDHNKSWKTKSLNSSIVKKERMEYSYRFREKYSKGQLTSISSDYECLKAGKFKNQFDFRKKFSLILELKLEKCINDLKRDPSTKNTAIKQ
jgi:hypothetical protein